MLKLIYNAIQYYLQNYKGLPKISWLGILLVFIDSVAGGLVFFLSIYFVNNLSLSIKISGLLISSYGFGTVLGGICGGKLSDAIPSHIVVKLSLLLQAFSFLLLIKLRSTEMLTVNLLMMGVTAYTFKTSINCWMLDQSILHSELRLKVLNISRVASNLGLAISGVIIGAFAKNNFLLLFFISGLVFLITACLFIFSNQYQSKKMITKAVDVESNSYVTHKNILLMMLIFVFFYRNYDCTARYDISYIYSECF